MKSILSDLSGLFFPDLCVVCKGRLVAPEKHICLECLNKLPKTGYHNFLNNKLEAFFAGRFPFHRTASFAYFIKGGAVQSIIHSLKYRNNPDIGLFVGELCARDLCGSDFIRGIDYIVPVPLHPSREKERGYNQSQKIAEGLSLSLNIPVCSKVLLRKVNNVSQTKHSKFERWSNMEGVFTLVNNSIFAHKHILLIDDIITTGSTIESCVKALSAKENNITISVYSVGAVV